MLGKLEAALESAAGDALMEQGGGRLVGVFALAGNGEYAILHVNRQVLLGKAGDSQRDSIVIFIAALDIVGRIALLGRGLQQADQAIEADSGAEKGRVIDTHGQPPESVVWARRNHFARAIAGYETGPIAAAGTVLFGTEKARFKAFAGLENHY
jgi:hypothetical protein